MPSAKSHRKPLTEEQRLKAREASRRYRANNADKVRESNRKWAAAHPDNVKAHRAKVALNMTPEQRARKNARHAEWKRRNKAHVNAYERAWMAAYRAKNRTVLVGKSAQQALAENAIYAAAKAVVPVGIPKDVRDDIISMICLAVLEGEIKIDDVPRLSREFTNRHYRQFSKFNTVSLDAPIWSDSGKTLHDTLTTENAVLL